MKSVSLIRLFQAKRPLGTLCYHHDCFLYRQIKLNGENMVKMLKYADDMALGGTKDSFIMTDVNPFVPKDKKICSSQNKKRFFFCCHLPSY